MAYTIKQILLSNQNWWSFYQKYFDKLRPAIVITITKLLSCKETIRGYHEYRCSNSDCSHFKRIAHTCKCKACSSCGKKATELWIDQQNQILPRTSWQHITFTMPSELWDFFWLNRFLLNKIAAVAANALKTIADKKNAIPGIFVAIHTFGRDLKRNVHIHLSTTMGGISSDNTRWVNLFFDQKTLMRIWRYGIIKLFRQSKLILPQSVQRQLNHTFTLNHFFNVLYKKNWVVHCNDPADNHQNIVSYLGRYIKRLPIAESKLKHYNGYEVTFRHLDHTSNAYRNLTLSVEDFIAKFIQHIPDIGFRVIRYYGFLAHRVRGNLLPLVHTLLGNPQPIATLKPTFAVLIQKNFNFNPLTCILCGYEMLLCTIHFGNANTTTLLQNHRALALMKKI